MSYAPDSLFLLFFFVRDGIHYDANYYSTRLGVVVVVVVVLIVTMGYLKNALNYQFYFLHGYLS